MSGECDRDLRVTFSGLVDHRRNVHQNVVARVQEAGHDHDLGGSGGDRSIDCVGDAGFGHLEVCRNRRPATLHRDLVHQRGMGLLGARVAAAVGNQDRDSRRCHVATVRCRAVTDNAGADSTSGADSSAGADSPAEHPRDVVGVGPHGKPWPDDPRLDPQLLEAGDRRNVQDEFRYWRIEAIVEELDRRRFGYHVAIENWGHDFNIGTVVRNANAFGAAAVHIVGRRRWNRRGAMVTDRYCHVLHHPDFDSLARWSGEAGLALVGIDNLDGSVPLESAPLPAHCVLLFGQEGPGLSERARTACAEVRSITMYGSTRSINAGVASGIAMHAWLTQHAPGVSPPTPR